MEKLTKERLIELALLGEAFEIETGFWLKVMHSNKNNHNEYDLDGVIWSQRIKPKMTSTELLSYFIPIFEDMNPESVKIEYYRDRDGFTRYEFSLQV